jgi:hypothetical protein
MIGKVYRMYVGIVNTTLSPNIEKESYMVSSKGMLVQGNRM